TLPLGLVTILVTLRHVPESKDETMAPGIDYPGALLGVLGLAGLTYALIEASNPMSRSKVVLAAALGTVALVAFVVNEARSAHPMLPLEIFKSRLFTATNVVTFVRYGALGGTFFIF